MFVPCQRAGELGQSAAFSGYTHRQMQRAKLVEAAGAWAARLAKFWHKLQQGEPVTVLALGGSLTLGVRLCCSNTRSWAMFLQDWLRARFPVTSGAHKVINKGRGSMDVIGIEALWPFEPGMDLVIVETAINDFAIVENFAQNSPVLKAAVETIVQRVADDGAALLFLELIIGGMVDLHGFW